MKIWAKQVNIWKVAKKGADLVADVVKKSHQRKRDDINNQFISGSKHTWPLAALSVRERLAGLAWSTEAWAEEVALL